MDLIKSNKETLVGITFAYGRNPLTFLITIGFYWGSWIFAFGNYLEVMVDRTMEEYPKEEGEPCYPEKIAQKVMIDLNWDMKNPPRGFFGLDRKGTARYSKILNIVLRKI